MNASTIIFASVFGCFIFEVIKFYLLKIFKSPIQHTESINLEFKVEADEAIQKLEELKRKMAEVERQRNNLNL